jgi:allantoinase
MPTSEPPVNSGSILTQRAVELQPAALVDYALYGGAAWENRREIAAMAAAGAVAFRTWLHAPAPGREAEFLRLSCPDAGQLHEVMREVARTGLVHALHCEHEQILTVAGEAARQQHGVPGAVHAAARPQIAEGASVATVLALAAATGVRAQPVLVSSAESVVLAAEARARGVQVTIETCPHYLQLDEKALFEFGPWAKCNPPLRSAATVERLWDELRAGRVDVFGTDHCPYRPEEIATGEEDIFRSPPGLPGLETMLPILLTAAHDGYLTLPDVVRLTSTRAAEIFDLPAKGRIAPGVDADFGLVDTTSSWTFRPEGFSKAAPNATFLGEIRFTGRVVTTFSRGRRVLDGGHIVGDLGHGRFVRPDRARVAGRRAATN